MTPTPPDFIFMLTNQDRTVADAAERLTDVLSAGVRHIGFKDIGLPFEKLSGLASAIKAAGARVYLEVVSLDEESERRSAQAAVELGIDILMGGTRPTVVLPVIAGTSIRYYPFPGKIVGHPSKLEGTIETIVASACDLAEIDGVAGLDLLAYRFSGDVETLMVRVCEAVEKPVVIAGSIDSPDRMTAVVRSGAAGFTIGTAAFNGAFSGGSDFRGEIEVELSVLDEILSRTAQPRSATIKVT